MLIRFVSALLLCHAANFSRSDQATHVDLLELNTYKWADGCIARQVIAWEWNEFDQCYDATRYFLLGREDESSIPYRTSRHKWRFMNRNPFDANKAVILEADDFIMTETSYDVWNAEMIRQGYIAI